jgi:hypothetical protein
MLRRNFIIGAIISFSTSPTIEGLAPPPTSLRQLQCANTFSTTALDGRRRSKRRKRRGGGRSRRGDYDDDEYDEDDDCVFYEREELSITGLAKSIDAEYKIEEEKLGLSFWEVLQRERKRPIDQISQKSRHMTPLERTKRRMEYAKGNVENKYVMMTPRQYGNVENLEKDPNEPPTLDDLNQKPGSFGETYWSKGIFRAAVVVFGYLTFPLWCKVFINFQTVDPDDFSVVVGQIAPNIGVLYATLLSLTLSVLYQRFTRIQENASTEAMLLCQITRNLLTLFADEPEWAAESCQMVANQVRIMLSRTRGVELLSVMKADTYANLLAIVDDYHYLHGCDDDFTARQESICGMLRGELQQITETRALRLSDEASSLPPTHFLLITSLSVVSIIAYVTASLAVVEDVNAPPQEASLLFAGLLALYILFFNFCKDLNGPFAGVYQIKRSNAASHLLQTKWLVVNQLGDKVTFGANYDEQVQEEEQAENESLLDKIKAFFSGSKSEEIRTVEANVMEILDAELQTPIEPLPSDVLDELCEAAPPGLKSLNCDPSAPEYRLLQLQDELAKLKWLNEQLNADVDVTQLGKGNKALAQVVESRVKPITEEATGITFDSKLDDDDNLYLVGCGVRKKAMINLYGVAMYSSPTVMEVLSPLQQDNAEARKALANAARTFDSPSHTTSFVVEMAFKTDAKTIAQAIANSVARRYEGPEDDVSLLEELISDGVRSKGGQASRGTKFRFDCSAEGVSVSVDGDAQGNLLSDGMGAAFVDVFMDDHAVSPQLVNNCLDSWCGSGIKEEMENVLAKLSQAEEEKIAPTLATETMTAAESNDRPFQVERNAAAEAKVQSLKEKATGVTFNAKLDDGLYLVGCGVRKKAIINVYAVAMYSSPSALEALSPFSKGSQKKEAQTALRNAARTFGPSSPTTSFALEMTFKADGKTIAEAIAEGVKPRHGGSPSDVTELENLIVQGVAAKGGQATKGTIFRFDCSEEGVSVSVDGNAQGAVNSNGIGSALVDVFMDDKAVSPQLVDSCLDTWCGNDLFVAV